MEARRRRTDSDNLAMLEREAPPVQNGQGAWVRWALGLLFASSVASLSYVVNLSNRTTAIEVSEGNALRQREELISSLGDLRSKTDTLGTQVTILNQFLEEYRRERSRDGRPNNYSRMFDK